MSHRQTLLSWKLGWLLLPLVYLVALRLALRAEFSVAALLAGGGFSVLALLGAGWLRFETAGNWRARANLAWSALLTAALPGGWLAVRCESSLLAWVALAAWWGLCLKVQQIAAGRRFGWRWLLSAAWIGALAAVAPVLFNQAWVRFSEEEFFVAVQALLLLGLWGCLIIAQAGMAAGGRSPQGGRWLRFDLRIALALAGMLLLGGGAALVRAYQASFYDPQAALYAAITPEQPFLCGQTANTPAAANTPAPFLDEFVAKLSALPQLSTPDLAFLWLVTQEPRWAAAFHEGLLSETRQKLFTTPANSVKFDQYLAALRAYAYARVREKQAQLFTPSEVAEIEAWFHAINRRAMTVEWVDWMYGLAFTVRPEGPYENQENGAGLIALLEAERLADPALAQRNRDYLARHRRGWEARFHNTDDSLVYQAEWITNAYFQSLYRGTTPAGASRRSFEWLLYQMLPDGRAPQVNFPAGYELSATLYFGASLLQDGRFLWLAQRSLQAAGNQAYPPHSVPGMHQPVFVSATPPQEGSCLLYSDSGLPTQPGPLAADKVILRQGWQPDDLYVMLNLRFAGWHRYKGTNTITLIDQGGALVNERINGAAFAWLPAGRSLFRDKRIPRENLNGFQLERRGLDSVLVQLLGYGSPWAQDPPWLADVMFFSAGDQVDVSQTRLSGWHGWDQTRTIMLDHRGILAVVDEAEGPPDQRAAITWHLAGGTAVGDGRFRLEGGRQLAEMALVTAEPGSIALQAEENKITRVLYTGPANGRMRLVTVFLGEAWVGGQVSLAEKAGSLQLHVDANGRQATLDLTLPGGR